MENDVEKIEKAGGRSRRKTIMILTGVGFLAAGILAILYIYLNQSRIYVENSFVVAPEVFLSSQNGGILERLYVSEGNSVEANEVVAEVDQELVKSKESGLVISAPNQIGKRFGPNETILTIIKPSDFRVEAHIEEDKGLNEVAIGQRAFFTVDAFGKKQYEGIVDEVTPTSRDQDIVFNISTQRQEQQFNIKIRFDVNKYPELRNGMSAKTWIYKD